MTIAPPTPPTSPLAATPPAAPQPSQPQAKHGKGRIRTVLVASHGWPTEATPPAKKRAARR